MASPSEKLGKRGKAIDITRVEFDGGAIMFFGCIPLAQAAFDMCHLLVNQRAVRQMLERFCIGFHCASKVAQNTIAINALRDESFAKLRLKCHRLIGSFLDRSRRIRG